jgi:putative intracellular protease/amidase
MARPKRILMVVTSYNHLDAKHPTGVWFEEFSVPYREFRTKAFEVTVASPQGGAAPIDPRSEPGPEQAPEVAEAREALQHTTRLASINANEFDAIFIPGGHGPLFDFPGNIPLQNTLRT